MSRELFKSMTYKDGKVFTRQCSNNVTPKDFYSEEHPGLTKRYNELGERSFEKWFLTNCIMPGNVEILNGSNKTLKRLNYVSNLLWKDDDYRQLYDNEDKSFMKSLSAKTDEEKAIAREEGIKSKEDIANYISSFYDDHISKFRDTERGR